MAATFRVAGVTYDNPDGENRQQIIHTHVFAGDALNLVPEPENPYDAGAIMVMHKHGCIGYVPKGMTRHFSAKGSAKVQRKIGGGHHLSYGVVVEAL